MAIAKSDTAFRTIGEAAAIVGVPQHVLRFWETRFTDLQPLKRGGNRRYYRPADMALLETIRAMLHDQGLTIRGAQLALAASKRALLSTDKPAPSSPGEPAPTGAATSVDIAPEVVPALVLTGIELAQLRTIRDRLRAALAA
jgi:DNA-binding transcriptional MerR regulator